MNHSIHIPEPCHEKWSLMKDSGKGKRHCGMCKKHVHDFTKSSFTEIRQKLSEEKVCGRYHERHTTDSSRFYNFLNAFENASRGFRLKKISLFLVGAALLLSGCARRHRQGMSYPPGGDKYMRPPNPERSKVIQKGY